MPIYEYDCEKCHETIEKIQKVTDPPLKKCEKCGGELIKLISKSSFKLIGEGFYCNDYVSNISGVDEQKKNILKFRLSRKLQIQVIHTKEPIKLKGGFDKMINQKNTKKELPEIEFVKDGNYYISKPILVLFKCFNEICTTNYQYGNYEDGEKWANWYDFTTFDIIDIDSVSHWVNYNLPEQLNKRRIK